MRRYSLSNVSIAIAALMAASIFVWTGVHALYFAPDISYAPPNAPVVAASSSDPVRLIIPSLHINAAVQYVGVKADGSMGTPNNFTDVAWYKYGTTPGQLGSAVIDGHVDNGLGLDGVFKHLQDIQVGADIFVQEKDGQQLHFKVIDIETYPYKNVPLQTVFAQTDAARLNLVTCEGVWVPNGKTYDHRLVVYTELQSS